MRYLKAYEQLNDSDPKIGDYVICNEPDNGDEIFDNFLKTTIGKIINYSSGNYDYVVKFDDAPDDILFYFGTEDKYRLCRSMKTHEVIYWSENKEDLEPLIKGNKYNL